MLELNKIYCGDCLKVMKQIDNESINCCVTSPPYWALRDYGIDKQLGIEPTFEEYINKLCNIFDEVKKVLRKDGTCWVVIGDSYNNSSWQKDNYKDRFDKKIYNLNKMEHGRGGQRGYPDKCLVMIPFRFAIEMVNRGWILRNTIIWEKPNCMPASIKDRFTVDFEYVFFFVKNKKYWFEQQLEPHLSDYKGGKRETRDTVNYKGLRQCPDIYNPEGRNKRAVWQVTTKPFPEAHFAVYPEELIEPMIRAGCPEDGIVLDPFMGKGTTAIVAKKQGKNFIGIDINPKYCDMANKKIANTYRQMELIK